jgi:ABC-type phosphate/phosphonate transport system substrate-binding protein
MKYVALLLPFALLAGTLTAVTAADPEPLTMIVTDPFAAPLALPGAKASGHRDYDKLAKYLEGKLGRPVKVFYGETVAAAQAKMTGGQADLFIGQESTIRLQLAATTDLRAIPVAALTGKDGTSSFTGLIVVAAADPANSAGDLKGYRFLFGPPDADERYSSILNLLTDLSVPVPERNKRETGATSAEAASKVLELSKKGEKVAAAISSYALPMLEESGTIHKGDLRVVGETEQLRFVLAFLNLKVPRLLTAEIRTALLDIGKSQDLCTALDSKSGFLPMKAPKKKKR